MLPTVNVLLTSNVVLPTPSVVCPNSSGTLLGQATLENKFSELQKSNCDDVAEPMVESPVPSQQRFADNQVVPGGVTAAGNGNLLTV